ncbi:MAG: L-fucose/L-arabinose isomerase family protein [bacterium]|nr:L-fucose/L-arabinose isomerase family protein [bacterium]
MKKNAHRKAKIGVFGIGLDAYWTQFPGIRDKLIGYQQFIESRIAGFGADVASSGLVDNVDSARKAGDLFAADGMDMLMCYAATYATSSVILPVVQRAKCPVVVLNLQPVASLDYKNIDTRTFLENCGSCPVPEISCAFARAGIPFNVVTGVLHDDHKVWEEIREWCEAASVVRNLNRGRIGFLGHVYPGMLDMYSDFTAFHSQLGTHIEILEMCDLEKRTGSAGRQQVEEKLGEIKDLFQIAEDSGDNITGALSDEDLEWSARVACGLDGTVADFALDGLTYYYRGLDGNPYERLGAGMIVGNSLLTARGIPAAGEGDLKTCIAMLIMECLGAGGSFTEFIAMDFKEEFMLMGHDGPGHIAISDRKPVLRRLGLYHGKRGCGCSVEFSVRKGPITILGITQDIDGRLKMLVAEGECLPGETAPFGNTNSRLKFPLGPADFIAAWCEHGPSHHVALGTGHIASKLGKLARILDMKFEIV